MVADLRGAPTAQQRRRRGRRRSTCRPVSAFPAHAGFIGDVNVSGLE
jgi:hypothetical protein